MFSILGGHYIIKYVILIFGKYIQEQISKKDGGFSHGRSQGDGGECRVSLFNVWSVSLRRWVEVGVGFRDVEVDLRISGQGK